MAEINSVTTGEHNGEEGLIVEWEFAGLREGMAEFRAMGMTAMRFPTTITEAEVIEISEVGAKSYAVKVFVPTKGFPSVGISNPIDWIRDNFATDKVDLGDE